ARRRAPERAPRRRAGARRARVGADAPPLHTRGRVRGAREDGGRRRRRAGGRELMRALAANIEDVFREAAARWTLIAYFALSSFFILIFALSVNLDIANGALAGARLFGKDLPMHGETVGIDKLVGAFESVFSGLLYPLATFLAIFATAHLVPRLQEKGTIDLYLSRPIGRVPLLMSRYLAGLLLSAANLVYLIGSIWAIVIWKTHVVHPRFLLAGTIILF